eukprot:GCRY01003114.1.p1 GENE.GCRY01003114.1~~GCRY01003114.1.p1  ORF type:complete len:454 (+),score=121.39 GCRY01003114.1:200-1561(+)
MLKVKVKWAKQTFEDVVCEPSEGVPTFKKTIENLTGVPAERQKILIKGHSGFLKDSVDLTKLNLTDGQLVTMMGTAAVLKEKPKDMDVAQEKKEETQDIEPYAGLANLGNTCYMNSVLQALKVVKPFRECLMNFKGLGFQEADPDFNIVVATRELFKAMDEAYGGKVIPLTLLQLFRNQNPSFAASNAQGFLQQDADEFFVTFMRTFKAKLPKEQFQSIFGGEMIKTYTPTEEGAESHPPSVSTFDKLSCFVEKDVLIMEDGIRTGLVGNLERRSEALGRNTLYATEERISKLPQYLVVHFVRFVWKPKQNLHAKVLKAVRFPMELDVLGFCSPELKAQIEPIRRKMRAKVDAAQGLDPEAGTMDIDAPESLSISSTGKYSLEAVVTHSGRSAEGGHYMAYTRSSRPGEFYHFNDEKIRTVTEDFVKTLSGGGDAPIAYMLVYKGEDIPKDLS